MKKIYEVYNRIEKNLLGLIMCVLIIMGFTQVLCRFVFKMSLAGRRNDDVLYDLAGISGIQCSCT